MGAGALIRVAPHHELIRIIRMPSDVHVRMVDYVIRVFGLRTVRTAKLEATVVTAELVLHMRRLSRVKYAAILADTAPNLGEAASVRHRIIPITFHLHLPWSERYRSRFALRRGLLSLVICHKGFFLFLVIRP